MPQSICRPTALGLCRKRKTALSKESQRLLSWLSCGPSDTACISRNSSSLRLADTFVVIVLSIGGAMRSSWAEYAQATRRMAQAREVDSIFTASQAGLVLLSKEVHRDIAEHSRFGLAYYEYWTSFLQAIVPARVGLAVHYSDGAPLLPNQVFGGTGYHECENIKARQPR